MSAAAAGDPVRVPPEVELGDGAAAVQGRDPSCDIVLRGPAVSRRHGRLTLRDSAWILDAVGSTNGRVVNRARVGRCKFNAGNLLVIRGERLLVY